jgi:Tol biopolymer transport system component
MSANCGADKMEFVVTVNGTDLTVAFVISCFASEQLAVVSGEGTSAEIYLVNSDGPGSTQLTSNSVLDEDPAWSPDGSQIVFASEREGNREIYVMNADGSNAVRLTTSSATESSPAWSPDGNRIAFVSSRDGDREIYVMNADGTNPERLTSSPGSDLDPTWSPDGRQLAYSSERGGVPRIYVMDATGNGQRQVTLGWLGDTEPAWSADGEAILFIREIRIVNGASGYQPWSVAPDGTNAAHLAGQALSGQGTTHYDNLADLAVSPAGGRIAWSLCSSVEACQHSIQLLRDTGTFMWVHEFSARNPAWRP